MRRLLLPLALGIGVSALALLAFWSAGMVSTHAQEEVPDEGISACDTDLDLDGLTDVQDLVLIAVNLFADAETQPDLVDLLDLTGDGLVDVEDLAAAGNNFGLTCAENSGGSPGGDGEE